MQNLQKTFCTFSVFRPIFTFAQGPITIIIIIYPLTARVIGAPQRPILHTPKSLKASAMHHPVTPQLRNLLSPSPYCEHRIHSSCFWIGKLSLVVALKKKRDDFAHITCSVNLAINGHLIPNCEWSHLWYQHELDFVAGSTVEHKSLLLLFHHSWFREAGMVASYLKSLIRSIAWSRMEQAYQKACITFSSFLCHINFRQF